MADPPNPAIDSYQAQQRVLMGAPQPGVNYLGSGNQQMDAMFAMYAMLPLMQAMGGKFIPQQFPAQNVLDQMVASKYMTASFAADRAARDRGTEILSQRLNGLRRQGDQTPLSPMGAAQFNNLAGIINNPFVMPLLEQALGPQTTEDLFFGRRGDPAQLQRAVNAIGFYRPDSVTGSDRMSRESLEQFSDQIYSNLYGPDADLNDISGFSAGRVGTMMTDLGRRGLLPQSMSKMTSLDRSRALAELGYDPENQRFKDDRVNETILGDANADVRKAIAENAPLDEIEKLAGGAETVRKIDATRVSNSLKGYAEAVASVRQIFGDSGISNAPMGQLIAALEALTQNSMSSMTPGKIENLMRRTQMAARDSGVNLEALMGLSARSGAMAQQRGLSPEMATFANVMAMEHGRAMRDSGAFTPGFGRMDPDKSLLFAAEAGLNAADSRVGRYLGAAARAVAETRGGENTSAGRLISAIRNGETTFTHNGRMVNIAEELARRPDQFMAEIMTAPTAQGGMGLTKAHFDALVNDPGTQEFSAGLEGSLALARQAEEYKFRIGLTFAGRNNADLANRAAAAGIDTNELNAIQQELASGFSTALVDNVNTTMTAEKRIDTLYSAMRESLKAAARTSGVAEADLDAHVTKRLDQLYGKGEGEGGGEAGARAFLSQEMARAGTEVQNRFGLTLAQLQQMFNRGTILESTDRNRRNAIRAGLNINVGDGSNFLQRFSDALTNPNGKPFLETILGAVSTEELQNELMAGLTNDKDRNVLDASFDQMRTAYAAATIDTEEEKKTLIESAIGSQAGFDAFAAQAAASGDMQFTGKKLVDDNTIKSRIRAGLENAATRDKLIASYAAATGTDKADAVKIFENLDSPEAKKALSEFASNTKLRGAVGNYAGIIGTDDVTVAEVRQAISDGQFYKAGITAEEKRKIEAFGQLNKQMDSGRVDGQTITDIYGIQEDKAEKTTAALDKFLKDGGSEDDLKKELDAVGLTGEQREQIEVMARFSRNINAIGGFEQMGAAGLAQRAMASGRITALERAAERNDLKTDDDALLTVIAKNKRIKAGNAKNETLNDKEKEMLEIVRRGTDEEFKELVEKNATIEGTRDTAGTVATVLADSKAEAGKITKAAGEDGGIVGQITSAISSALSSAFGDAMKDVKIETVTITNLKLPDNIGTTLAAGLVSSAANAIGAALGGGKDSAAQPTQVERTNAQAESAAEKTMTLTGTVKLDGLDKLIAQLEGTTARDIAPNGIPVGSYT